MTDRELPGYAIKPRQNSWEDIMKLRNVLMATASLAFAPSSRHFFERDIDAQRT